MNIKIFNNDIPADLKLDNEEVVALDCEALGLVLGRDPLTLIQIGLKSKDCYIIKLNRENFNAPNFFKFLSKNSTQFIMHYARQDLLWLKHHLNVEPPNIFCTKLASKIARTASSYHGYKDLVREICGKDISKKEQQSDWGGNLTDKQIQYAAQDTQFLFDIKDKLIEMLKRENRYELYNRCLKALPILVEMENSGFKITTFEH